MEYEYDNVIKRKILEDIFITVDKDNPKFELNYCFVDLENIVSTNTRAITIAEHGLKVDGCFFIERNLIEKAIKERKAKYYKLKPSEIIAYDEQLNELITFKLSYPCDKESFKYLDYKRIIPEKVEKKISFVDNSQINGIFAINKVDINPSWIPKTKYGYVCINEINSPVSVKDPENNIQTIIMPIIDRFKEFDENGFL